MPDTTRGNPREHSPAQINELTCAFRDFNVIIERFQETFQGLQNKIDILNQIVEKKNAELEKQIHEGENIKNLLHGILEHVYTGVVVIDTSGAIILFNKAAEDITGYEKDEVLGSNYLKLFGNAQVRTKSPLYTLTTGKESFHRRKIMRTKDKKPVNVEFSSTLVKDVHGEVMGVVETFNDISEISNLQRRVTQVETLAALGEMAANVAHEIRNPLGGIGGFAGLLDRKLAKDDPNRKLIKPIVEGVSRLNTIVSDLLSFTRPQKLNPVKVVLQDTLQEIIDFFRISLGNLDKDVELITQFPDNEIHVYLDSQLFQQIVINLLKNAYDAIEDSGTIEVRIRMNMPESLSDVLDEDEKDELLRMFSYMEIDIVDNGIGIPEETLPKLFNPFFTTKDDGNGLGLAITRKIINLHKGDITVASEVNKGTTFTISLPLYETYHEL